MKGENSLEKNSKLVLAKGEAFCEWGKKLTKIWLAAWVLLVVVILLTIVIDGAMSVPVVLTFTVVEDYAFTIPIVLVSYLGIVFGPILYISGLQLIGLGQIAMNTDKE